jgi:SLBB domain
MTYAADTTAKATATRNDPNDIFLSKEKPMQRSGNIYFSSQKEGELLYKANVWGAVHFPGIHYVSNGTRLLDAISLAGGPLADAKINNIQLTTTEGGKQKITSYSLSDTLSGNEIYNPLLKPGDVMFVEKSFTDQNVNLWLNVGSFVLSLVAVGILIDDRQDR